MLHDAHDTKVEWTKGRIDIADPRVITLVASAGEVNNRTVEIPQALLNAWERRAIASPDKNSPGPATSSGFRGFNPSRPGSELARGLSRMPSLVQARRNLDFANRIQLTTRQQSELNQLSRRRDLFLSEVESSVPNLESIAKIKDRLREIEKEALEILSAEQQQIWEKRSAELIPELINAEVIAIRIAEQNDDAAIVRLRQDYFRDRANLISGFTVGLAGLLLWGCIINKITNSRSRRKSV